MSRIADSKAQFDQRLQECHVPLNLQASLKAAGIETISILAYSFGQPGQFIDDAKFQEWAKTIEPTITIGAMGTLKKLLFESQTQLLALLKEQVTQPDNFTHRKIPQAEREAKMTTLRGRLVGQLVEGSNEPGHALLDAAISMHDRNQTTYVAPEKCISRVHELTTEKSVDRLVHIEASKLVLKEQDTNIEISASTSLQVLEALRRRGLAFEFAEVMSFDAHERYIQTLFSHLHREPPPGYQRCTVSQLVSADCQAWRRVIQDGVKPRRDENGVKPLDKALIEALQSYEVSFALIPLPTKQASNPKQSSEHAQKAPGKPKQKLVGNKFAHGKKPKGKGKGGQKSKWEPKTPLAIREAGGTAMTPEGEPLCFSYSLSSCKHAADGGKCMKGLHLCPVCYGPHPLKDHPKH